MEIEEKFADRLVQLRMEKGVSARDMSLSIGQSPGYVNSIENKKNFPSMLSFFYICEYLGVTPKEFFEFDMQSPQRYNEMINYLKKMSKSKIDHLIAIAKDLTE